MKKICVLCEEEQTINYFSYVPFINNDKTKILWKFICLKCYDYLIKKYKKENQGKPKNV